MKKYWVGLFLFVFCFSFYLVAPVAQIADSNYSMMVSQSIIDNGTVRLDEYNIEKREPFSRPGVVGSGYPYQIESVGEKLYYYFPHGTSILSVPIVSVLNLFGLSAVDEKGNYDVGGEKDVEEIIAALLVSLTVFVFFKMAKVSLSTSSSLVLALVYGLGTSLLSTASRGMWAHTWLLVLTSCVLFLVWKGVREKTSPNPFLLATLVSWMYFVRPTSSISILAISFIVLVAFRRIFVVYALTGLFWLLGFVLYSKYHFDSFLPTYYAAGRLGSDSFLQALLGNAISPARGVLVYSPFILSIVFGLFLFRKQVSYWLLVWVAMAAIVSHWVVISLFPHWWGGYSYGPRFMTDIIPWFFLLAVIVTEAFYFIRCEGAAASMIGLKGCRYYFFITSVLVVISVFMNVRGAFSVETSMWNAVPNSIDHNPERLWSWKNPQFLAGMFDHQVTAEFPKVRLGDKIMLNTPEADAYLGKGWSIPESSFRWTDAKAAVFGFEAQERSPVAIEMVLSPFVTKEHDIQVIEFVANEVRVAKFVLGEQPLSGIRFVIPGQFVKRQNEIKLMLPDAVSPKSLGVSQDSRTLGVAVQSVTVLVP